MQIDLYRHPGSFGRTVPLDVLVNGLKVTSVKANQSLSFSLPDEGGTLQVAMHGAVASPVVHVGPQKRHVKLECGTPMWVLFDLMSLCYLPLFKNRVFFLREAARVRDMMLTSLRH